MPEAKPLFAVELPAPVTSVAISPSGLRVAAGFTAGNDNLIRVFDIAAGKDLMDIPDNTGAIRALAFGPDNRTIVSASADKNARVSDVGVLAVWNGHPGGVTSIAFNQAGTQALTSGADKTVQLWDLATFKPVRTLGPLPDPVTCVAFNRAFTHVG